MQAAQAVRLEESPTPCHQATLGGKAGIRDREREDLWLWARELATAQRA